MDLIHENPFRVLGLNANSTERELQKQIAKVKRYIDVGKTVNFPTDYPFLRTIERPIDAIHQASGQIEQSYKKFYYALFWFVSETSFDEIAHKKLEDNNVSSAIEIWNKKLQEDINDKNFSAYLNVSSLYLALADNGNRLNCELLSDGLNLKGKILTSQSLNKLAELLHLKLDCINLEDFTIQYVDEILQWLNPYIGKSNGIKSNEVIHLFSAFPSNIRTYVSDKFTEEPFLEIKRMVRECSLRRETSPLKANQLARNLYNNSKDSLDYLQATLGSDNVKYQLLLDNFANELIQCSIDYFNSQLKNENYDPHKAALLILKLIDKINTSAQIDYRLKENIDTLESLKAEREKEKKENSSLDEIKTTIANMSLAIKRFQYSTKSINTARNLIINCEGDLKAIRYKLGSADETYLMFCDALANNALNMLVDVINEKQENPKQYGLPNLLSSFSEAKTLTQKLLRMDGSNEVKAILRQNLQTISDLKSTLEKINKQNNSGCYVATMAYGSYDHPQVLVLRQFRDDVLSQSWYGRLFIKIYYKTSPYLVSLLQGYEKPNLFIKKQLDKFIRKLHK
jgi:hypothetical protein